MTLSSVTPGNAVPIKGFVFQVQSVSGVQMDGIWLFSGNQVFVDTCGASVSTVIQDGDIGTVFAPLSFSFLVPQTSAGDLQFR